MKSAAVFLLALVAVGCGGESAQNRTPTTVIQNGTTIVVVQGTTPDTTPGTEAPPVTEVVESSTSSTAASSSTTTTTAKPGQVTTSVSTQTIVIPGQPGQQQTPNQPVTTQTTQQQTTTTARPCAAGCFDYTKWRQWQQLQMPKTVAATTAIAGGPGTVSGTTHRWSSTKCDDFLTMDESRPGSFSIHSESACAPTYP